MKRLHLKEIHNTLSISKNKLGISLDSLYKSHPYHLSFDIFSDLISKDKYIEIDKNKKVTLKTEYYSTTDYTLFEEKHYNSNYLKTLFKEETNTIKLCIYKHMKHEILNEEDKMLVYNDIVLFLKDRYEEK